MSGSALPTLRSLEEYAAVHCPKCGERMYRHIEVPTATGTGLACPTSFRGTTVLRREAPQTTQIPTA